MGHKTYTPIYVFPSTHDKYGQEYDRIFGKKAKSIKASKVKKLKIEESPDVAHEIEIKTGVVPKPEAKSSGRQISEVVDLGKLSDEEQVKFLSNPLSHIAKHDPSFIKPSKATSLGDVTEGVENDGKL